MTSPKSPTKPVRIRPLARRVVRVATTAASLLLPTSGIPAPGARPAGLEVRPLTPRAMPMQLAQAAPDSDQDKLEKYRLSGYTYCDALVLASYWGEGSPQDAKLRMGAAILRNQPDEEYRVVSEARAEAREKAAKGEWLCSWDADGGFDDADLAKLAPLWGFSDPGEVQSEIQRMMIDGSQHKIYDALEQASPEARQPGVLASGYAPQYPEDEAIQKFYAFDYNYCDALVLAAFWGEDDAGDAKVRLGDKILAFGESDAEHHLGPARAAALQRGEDDLPCFYDDGGYSYEDVEQLAEYWGLAETWDGKIKVARMLVEGRDQEIKTELSEAKESARGG